MMMVKYRGLQSSSKSYRIEEADRGCSGTGRSSIPTPEFATFRFGMRELEIQQVVAAL